MPRIAAGALALLALAPLLSAQDKARLPLSVRVKALQRSYDRALAKYQQALQAARTPAEKEAAAAKHPRPDLYAERFLALARAEPKDPAAFDALSWVVRYAAGPASGDDPRSQALELLRRNHVRDERLGQVLTGLVEAPDPASEALLRRALAKSPHEGVRARACVSLAQNLKFRARTVERLKDPEVARQSRAAWGSATVAALRKRDPGALRAESEKLFRRTIKEFGTVRHPQQGTLARLAENNLAALRDPVAVGKPAPEISGRDQAGKTFKLSDYRGKVVLLDFWADAYTADRVVYKLERALVKRLAGRPFVLLGVNGDSSRERLKKVRAREKMTWRCWWDRGTSGPLGTRWEVRMWPTLFVIDAKGVVRHVFPYWPAPRELDKALAPLLEKAE
jgi:peroxiredoxin